MQDWVFDRDGARTRRDPPAAPEPPRTVAAVPRRRLGRRGRWLVAGGSTLAVVVAGATVAAGSTSSPPTPSAVAPTTQIPADPPQASGQQVPDSPAQQSAPDDGTTQDDSGSGSALHAEREVPRPDGTTVTLALQAGQLTEVAADSVTVASSDGFTRTYAITGDTRIATPTGDLSALQVGDAVLVESVVDGDTATATVLRTASAGGSRSLPGGGRPASPGSGSGTPAQQDTDPGTA